MPGGVPFGAMKARLPPALVPGHAARALGRMLAVFGLLGVAAGLAAVAFMFVLDLVAADLLYGVTDIDPIARGWGEVDSAPLSLPDASRWWVLVIPAFGGLLAGILCWRFAPEAFGTGTSRVIDVYHRKGGKVRGRVPIVKSIASALTIGSGGSAGVEGPVGLVAAGMGSLIARWAHLSAAERRILMLAGFAAGIGAVFHAPMAASIFAAEVVYRELDIEHEVLVPAIIASTTAYGVYGAIHGWEPVWLVPPVHFGGALELIPYTLLALVVAGAGAAFVLLNRSIDRHIGQNRRFPIWLRPALGGVGVGLVGLWMPHALGASYGIAQQAIDGSVGVLALLALAAGKMLTSAFTAGSGGSGGLFAPSLVIGAALGGAVGQVFADQLLPGVAAQPAAFAIVGMAGFFSAVISAPLSTVIMVSELAGSYRLLVPTLWVCAIAWLLNRHLNLFSAQVKSRLEAPGHLAEMMDAALRRISVSEALNPNRAAATTVPPQTTLPELVRLFASSHQEVYPIVDPETGAFQGVVDGRQLRRTIGEVGIDEVLIAQDFQAPALTATPSDTLHDVVSGMTATGYDAVVVVADDDPHELVGILPRRDVVSAYHRRMLETATEDSTVAEIPPPYQPPERPPEPDLYEAIRRGGVLYGVLGSDAEDTLRHIIADLDVPPEADRAMLEHLVIQRERMGSTNVGDGFALPHPQTDGVAGLSEPRVVIALLRRPVVWDASGAAPVRTVCMLIGPGGPAHLALLGGLARCLSDETLRRLLDHRAARKRILARVRDLLDEREE